MCEFSHTAGASLFIGIYTYVRDEVLFSVSQPVLGHYTCNSSKSRVLQNELIKHLYTRIYQRQLTCIRVFLISMRQVIQKTYSLSEIRFNFGYNVANET